jgi:hypothetical protein
MSRSTPRTFPGIGFYWPSVSCSSSASTLPMSDEDKRRAAELEDARGAFGFARVLDQHDASERRQEEEKPRA